MPTLNIHNIEHKEHGYRVNWSSEGTPHLRQDEMEVRYGFDPPKEDLYPFNILIALMLPVLAHEHGQAIVRSPYQVHPDIQAYWTQVLAALGLGKAKIHWEQTGTGGKPIQYRSDPAPLSGRPALLFGGGVESCFGLSSLISLNPVVLSFTGTCFMNNDTRHFHVKHALEERMIAEQNVHFERVETNAMSLLNKDDTYKSNYVTGNLFYWLSLPTCRRFGVNTIYKASELEEALDFQRMDVSLTPTHLNRLWFQNEAVFVPLYNAYPKIQMLDGLKDTPFLQYVYSCSLNTDQRWCGKCKKCHRIHSYCKYLGIDPARLGMPPEIVGTRETGISRHFWFIPDMLYGKPPLPERLHALARYRHTKGKKPTLQYLLCRLQDALRPLFRWSKPPDYPIP